MMLGVAFPTRLDPRFAAFDGLGNQGLHPPRSSQEPQGVQYRSQARLEPRVLPKKPEPETWGQLVTNKIRILRKSSAFGRSTAMKSTVSSRAPWKQMRDLPDAAKYDLALRIYDLLQYQDYALAKRYLDLVRGVYRRDSVARTFEATVAVIWNLAKVTLIKDEPYVA